MKGDIKMGTASGIEIRPYKTGEVGYIACMHMALYQSIYHFKPVFEKYLLMGLTEFIKNPDGSQLWVADDNEKLIGSIAICRVDDNTAQLRWFLVDPQYHGHGLGHKLMTAALDFCRERGYRHIFLWTADVLEAARHLYGKYGFVHVQDEPNYEWTDALITEERWDLCRNGDGLTTTNDRAC